MILEDTRESGSEELTRLGWRIRPIHMLNNLLFTNALIVQLIVMKPLLHILCSDGLVVLGNANWSGNLQDAHHQKWGENYDAIYIAPELIFIGCDSDFRGGGKIGGGWSRAVPSWE